MKAPAPAVIASIPLGLASAWFISVPAWEALRPALLPALSVIAAGVLVRLARGLPFTNADHFTLGEFRSRADKLKSIAHKLRTMMFVCLFAMIQVIVYPALLAYIEKAGAPVLVIDYCERLMSGLIALCTVYAFVRILEVIQIDVALLKLQARVLEKAIAAKNAKAFDKGIEAHPPGKIAGSEVFGRQLQ